MKWPSNRPWSLRRRRRANYRCPPELQPPQWLPTLTAERGKPWRLDLREQEQIDELKAFWRKWGTLITGVLVAVALGTAGVQNWRWYQHRQAESAPRRAVRAEMEALAAKGDTAKLVSAADDQGISRAPPTPPAPRWPLPVLLMPANDAKTAREQLNWVLEHANEPWQYRRWLACA